MPPEEPNCLVVLHIEKTPEGLSFSGERVFAWAPGAITTTWYTTGETPNGYDSVLDGLLFVRSSTVENRAKIASGALTRVDGKYCWKDTVRAGDLMIAMSIPPGLSLAAATPGIEEAKVHGDRVAVYWYLMPKSSADARVQVTFELSDSGRATADEAHRLNREVALARLRPQNVDFDLALSFAGDDRTYVHRVAELLSESGIRLFYDKFEEPDLWGKDLYSHLSEVYFSKARFTVMFISKAYAEKVWTNHERKAAQAKAFSLNTEYILPVRFDQTEVPGLLPTTAYVDAREKTPEALAKLLVAKLMSPKS